MLVLSAAVLSAGCLSSQTTTLPAKGDQVYGQAAGEFQAGNFEAAIRLYHDAYLQYQADGDLAGAKKALNRGSHTLRVTGEFPLNRTEVETAINETFPGVTAEIRAGWLSPDKSQVIRSDGRDLYFADTVSNIRFHNLDLMRNQTVAQGTSPFFDELKARVAITPVPGSEPYLNPITIEGTEQLTIPTGLLPKNGTLRLWVPMPVTISSQQNVTILSVEPARYVKVPPDPSADLGLVYLEVPLGDVTGDALTITTQFQFTGVEQRFVIEPSKVGSYNTSGPEYRKYTSPGKNIVTTPEMSQKARDIVGNETNPYLQAQKIYWYIMETLPYSHVPHYRLEAAGVPESTYVLETGFGDCGSQSMYFAALCRSLGIPARAVGGYQLVPGYEGTHFWAEYYLPAYGWVPVDVTIAEAVDWAYNATEEERQQWKEYYFGSLDPYRYVIQKDVDIPIMPDLGDVEIFRMAVQNPKAVCDTLDEDPELSGLLDNWSVVVRPMGQRKT